MKALVEGGEVVEALRERILGRTLAIDLIHPETQDVLFAAGTLIDEDGVDSDRQRRHRRGQGQDRAVLRHALGRLLEVLRARPRPRLTGQRRRGDRRDRRAVDRRTGHAADDADLPHRRRGVADRGAEQRRGEVRRHGALHRHHALRQQRQGRQGGDLAAPARSSSSTTTAASASATRCRTARCCWPPTATGARRQAARHLGSAPPADHYRVRRHGEVRARRGRRRRSPSRSTTSPACRPWW